MIKQFYQIIPQEKKKQNKTQTKKGENKIKIVIYNVGENPPNTIELN